MKDIVEVVSEYVELEEMSLLGRFFKGCCPFHKEKTASFVVDNKKQKYKCFGCGERGNANDFKDKIAEMVEK